MTQTKPTPRLDALFDAIEAVCKGVYGRKAALARYLGVAPQTVRDWVTARIREPGGEVTFAMQEWLTGIQAEVTSSQTKKKRPRSATNTARPITPKGTHVNEYPKSRSPKR